MFDPVGDGVRKGLDQAFKKGGAFDTALGAAMDKALDPLIAEMRRLRVIERRHQWHPIEKCPAWAMDGRPVLVSCKGDQFWACYIKEPDEDGYWDRDIEYGGDVVEPDHFFLLPRAPCPPAENNAPDDTGSERSEHRDAQTNTSLHSEEKEETR